MPDRGHAVVLGASIAGLQAARVLADHFERVTLLERDALPWAEQRRGVPQGRHVHGLMDRGRQIMEELFPGLSDELTSLGVRSTDVLVGSRWYFKGLRVRSVETGLLAVLASRPLLESVLRSRVEKLPGVTLRQRTVVTGLVTGDAGPDRVRGVRVRDGEGAEPEETVEADLVVDATGRGSRAPDWLAALGRPRPPEERVDVDLGYTSCLYRRRPEHLDGDLGVVVSTMPGFHGGAAINLEGERWQVTLTGMLGDHPPAEREAFEEFAGTLPVRDIHDIVACAEPIDDPVPYRFRGSLRRRYERVPGPDGFIAVGDAACSFNPLYAQGMTVAGQQALVLRECLRESGPLRPRTFYRQAARVIDVAWEMATGADLRYPGVEGRRSLRTRLVGAYAERAQVAAHVDPTVARVFMRLANLTEAPTALLAPGVVTRVLRHGSPARA